MLKLYSKSMVILCFVLAMACVSSRANAALDQDCFSDAANHTLNGNGIFIAQGNNAGFNIGSCQGYYKFQVNNYRPSLLGTLVGWHGAAPTTETQCLRTRLRVRIGVPGSSFNSSVQIDRSGTWEEGAFGGARCFTPSIDIGEELPSFMKPSAPNHQSANYRIVAKATTLGTRGPPSYQNIIYSIPKSFELISSSPSSSDAIDHLSSSITASEAQAEWARIHQTADSRSAYCRVLEVVKSMHEVNSVSLLTALDGASANQVNNALAFRSNWYNHVCNGPYPGPGNGGNLGLQLAIHINDTNFAYSNIISSIADTLSISLSSALSVAGKSFSLDASRILNECGTNHGEIGAYFLTGATPFGMTGSNVLFKNCSGTPQQIAIGSGVGSPVEFPGERFRSCMDKWEESLQDECVNPLTSEGGDTQQLPECSPPDYINLATNTCESSLPSCEPPSYIDLSTNQCIQNPNNETPPTTPPTESPKTQQELLQAENEYNESRRRIEILNEVRDIQNADEKYLTPMLCTAGGLACAAALVINYVENLLLDSAAESAADDLGVVDNFCKNFPSSEYCNTPSEGGNRRCVQENLGDNPVWYETPPRDGGDQVNILDAFMDCTCEMFENEYGEAPEVLGCPSQEAQEVYECVKGPDDLPDFECLKKLQPTGWDTRPLQEKICEEIHPEQQCNNWQVGPDLGDCGCLDGRSEPISPPGGPTICTQISTGGNAALCGNDFFLSVSSPGGLDDIGLCGCATPNSGLGCEKGGLSGYQSLPDLLDLIQTQVFPFHPVVAVRDTNFIMLPRGNVPLVTTKIEPLDFYDLRSSNGADQKIRLVTLLPQDNVPGPGFQGWHIQAYCTNRANNTFNHHIESIDLQFAEEGPNTFNIDMQDHLGTCFGSSNMFSSNASATQLEIRFNSTAQTQFERNTSIALGTGSRFIGIEDLFVANVDGLLAPFTREGSNTRINRVNSCAPPEPRPFPTDFWDNLDTPLGRGDVRINIPNDFSQEGIITEPTLLR